MTEPRALTYASFLEQCHAMKQDTRLCQSLATMLGGGLGINELDQLIGVHILTMFVFNGADFQTVSLISMQHANLIAILQNYPDELKHRLIFKLDRPNQAVTIELARYNAEAPDDSTTHAFNNILETYTRVNEQCVPFITQITPIMQQTAQNLSNVTIDNIDQREIQEQVRQEIRNIPVLLQQPGGILDTAHDSNIENDDIEGSDKPGRM